MTFAPPKKKFKRTGQPTFSPTSKEEYVNHADILDVAHQLMQQVQKPKLVSQWNEKLTVAFDTTEKGIQPEYLNDPVGYCKNELGINTTEDQERLLLSILNNEITIVKSATGVGKTFILAAAAVWLYKTRREIEIYAAAAPPEKNLKRLFWGELDRIISNHPEKFAADNISSLMIKREPKQHIEGLSIPVAAKDDLVETKFSGKHQANLVFFFDEADGIPDPVFKGADGCMSGGWTRMVMCLNPRRREGYPYRTIMDGTAKVISMSAFNHPNVITGTNVVPGAVTRDATVRRINEWSAPLGYGEEPDQKCFKLPEFLEGCVARSRGGRTYSPLVPGWYIIQDSQLYYKILGEYPQAGSNHLFDEADITAARSRYDLYVATYGTVPPSGSKAVIGIDVADEGDDSTVISIRYGGLVLPQIKFNGVDPDMVATKAAIIYKMHDVQICRVDTLGVGAGVPQKMVREGCSKAVGVKSTQGAVGVTEDGDFKSIRDQSYWLFRLWLKNDNGAMLPPGKLVEYMRAMTYERIGRFIQVTDKAKLKKLLGESPDEMDSLMLTFSPNMVWMGSM